MDINYLLALQSFREATGNVLTPLMELFTKTAEGMWFLYAIFFFYWAIDRAAGRRLIGGYEGGQFMNGLLKNTFCIDRPWVRDERVVPYGESKATATGYSFPSGHSTRATAAFGGLAVWVHNRFKGVAGRVVAVVLCLMVAGVMFSRNYLGVHTPQDVIFGFGTTALAMWAIYKVEDWTDADPKRDLYVIVGAAVLVLAAMLWLELKPWTGSLDKGGFLSAVDVEKTVGILAYAIGRYFDRRCADFEKMDRCPRVICALVALVPVILWFQFGKPVVKAALPKAASDVVMVLPVVYAMALVPFVMGLVAKRLEARKAAEK